MIDQQIEIATKDGRITTFISHPERGGPFPIILFYMDAPGIREELREMARRLASVGYYVMLPELYFACAEVDRWMPLEKIVPLRSSLKAADVDAEVELFPGVEHGFAFPARPAYNREAAERHWERLFALFKRRLG